MKSHLCVAALAAFVSIPPSAVGQTAAQSTESIAGPALVVTIAAATPVEIEFVAPISSKTAKIDDRFPIRLAAPILVEGKVAVPAGTMGEGQVVHSAKAGGGGKAGELIVTVRWLDHHGTRIALRRLRMGGLDRGADRRDGAFGVGAVIPLGGFLVRGGEKTIEPGAIANAIVAAEVAVTPAATLEAAGAH